MKKDIAQKVMQDPSTLRALIAHVDGGDPGELAKIDTAAWRITGLDGLILVDIYNSSANTAYIIAYTTQGLLAPRQGLFTVANIWLKNSWPELERQAARFVTLASDGIEITGFDPLIISGQFIPTNTEPTMWMHYDVLTNPGISELLAITGGKDIIPQTDLGKAAMEAIS